MTETRQLTGKRLALFRQVKRAASVMEEMREAKTPPEQVAKLHQGIAVASEFEQLRSLPADVFEGCGDVNPKKLKEYYEGHFASPSTSTVGINRESITAEMAEGLKAMAEDQGLEIRE